MNTIPYGRQYIDDDDINSVVQVLKSDFITQGKVVPEFELSLSNYNLIADLTGGFDSRIVFGALSKYTKNVDYYTHYISFSLEEYGDRDPFYVRYFNFRKFSKKPRIHIV